MEERTSRVGHLVAILLAVAILSTVLPLTGCIDDPGNVPDKLLVVALDTPEITRRDGLVGPVWDAAMPIVQRTPSSARARWADLQVVVRATSGSVLVVATTPVADTGYYDTSAEVWYREAEGRADGADVGDVLLITTMDRSYEGAQVEVLHKGERVGSIPLLGPFP